MVLPKEVKMHELMDEKYNTINSHPECLFKCKAVAKNAEKEKPTVRLVLATVALGMGLNAPSVSRVIHMRPPVCLENYLQEIGRAGRSGQPASAVLFYNNSDTASNRKGMTGDMMMYCINYKRYILL